MTSGVQTSTLMCFIVLPLELVFALHEFHSVFFVEIWQGTKGRHKEGKGYNRK
jgi:hypothetical protein